MNVRGPIEPYIDPNHQADPLPWIYHLAAEIESVDVHEFDSDPDTLERTLRSVGELFELPAVAVPFDSTVLAEAMGCDISWSETGPDVADGCVETVDDAFDLPIEDVADIGRVPTTIEAVSRLSTTLTDRGVLAAVPGPTHLAALLTVENPSDEILEEALWSAGDAIVETARSYLDAGADALVVLEPAGISDEDSEREVFEPILNVVDYYDIASFLATQTLDETSISVAEDVGFDVITGHPTTDFDDPGTSIAIGYGEPIESFTNDDEFTGVPDGFDFSSSQWEVPSGIPVERVHRFMRHSNRKNGNFPGTGSETRKE